MTFQSPAPRDGNDRDRHHQVGQSQEPVGETHQQRVYPPPENSTDQRNQRAQHPGDDDCHKAHDDRYPGTIDHSAEYVPPQVVWCPAYAWPQAGASRMLVGAVLIGSKGAIWGANSVAMMITMR